MKYDAIASYPIFPSALLISLPIPPYQLNFFNSLSPVELPLFCKCMEHKQPTIGHIFN